MRSGGGGRCLKKTGKAKGEGEEEKDEGREEGAGWFRGHVWLTTVV